jgi:hypothetical protein
VTVTLLDDQVVPVSYGDLLFDTVDEHGTQLVLHDLKGWGSPAGTGGVTQREAGDGGWRVPQYASPKVMVLTGTIRALDPVQRELAEYALQSAINLDLALMTVSERTGTKQLWVQRDSDWDLTHVNGHRTDWQVSIVAPDPIKYGAAEHEISSQLPLQIGGFSFPLTFPFTIDGSSLSGDIQIVNAGNHITWPRLIINGPVDQPTVTNITTGESFTYRATLQAGEWVDIDTHPDGHTVMLLGTASRRQLLVGDFWGLVPGLNSIAFRAASSSPDARLDVIWRDAWN